MVKKVDFYAAIGRILNCIERIICPLPLWFSDQTTFKLMRVSISQHFLTGGL